VHSVRIAASRPRTHRLSPRRGLATAFSRMRLPTSIASARVQISHTKFSIWFCCLLFAICNAINIGTLARWFHGKSGLNYLAFTAYLIAGLALFIVVFLLLAHRWTIKLVAILLTLASAACTYFIAKYNVAIDSSMVLNAVHTDRTEVGQLLSVGMLPYFFFLVLLPLAAIFLVRITFAPRGRYLIASLKLMGVGLVVTLACLYLQYNPILTAGNVSKKYIVYSLVPINALASSISVGSKAISPYFAHSKKAVQITGKVTATGNLVVVLAVGESSRRRNFSLYGYQRQKTNPELETIEGLHLLNGVATRGSTIYALPKILEKDGVKLPALVSKLGIPTSCLVNYTLYDNCASVGEIAAHDCAHGGKCFDEDVIPLLRDNLRTYESGYRLVVLHFGGGSHGPIYSDRYPPEFQRFKPMCKDADVANQCTREQLYNSYDNTILYVDHVLAQTIHALDESHVPYVFIYLSDHGESLLEDGRMFHGMPPGVTLPPEQAEIPLIVKSSIPISVIERPEYQQQDVFDSVVDLLSIQTDMFGTPGAFIKKQQSSSH
jgi:lipid A ethanolaminephosphotransferase